MLIYISENHLMNIGRIYRNIDDHFVKHIGTWKYQVSYLNVLFTSKYWTKNSRLYSVASFSWISFKYLLKILNKILFNWVMQYNSNLGCIWQNQMLLRLLNWFRFLIHVYVEIILLIRIISNHFLLFKEFIFL